MNAIATWVRAERQRLGLCREDLEELCGVSVKTVQRLEHANEAIALGSVRAVVEALGGRLEVVDGNPAR